MKKQDFKRWWRSRLGFWYWVTEEIVLPKWIPESIAEPIYARLERSLAAVCWARGHLVDDDHCGIPAHRFCCRCGNRFPNAPIGGTDGVRAWPKFHILSPLHRTKARA